MDQYEKLIYDTIRASETARAVDAAWERLDTLEPAARRHIVDALEKLFIADLSNDAADYAPRWSEVKNNLDDLPRDAQMERMIGIYQAMGQVFLHVAQEKGDEAHPVTKDYAEKAVAAAAEDYDSLKGQIDIMVSVYNAFSMPKEPPRPSQAFPLASAGKQPKALMPPPPKQQPQKGRRFTI